MRLADEDRDRAAAELRDHFAAGRLNDEELSDRLSAIYRAKTDTELAAVVGDMPKLPATARAELVQRRAHLQRRLLQQTGGSLGAFLICTVIWLTSGATGQFWPIWVALVAIVPLIRNGWRLYGPAPEFDRVEEELTRREHQRHGGRDERRERRRQRRY